MVRELSRLPALLAVALAALACEAASPAPAGRALGSGVTQAESSVEVPRASGNAASAQADAPPPPPALEDETLRAPSTLEKDVPRPFLLVLHGLGGSGPSLARFLGIEARAERRKLLWAAPSGVLDGKKRRFWNASASCCDFEGRGPDHVAALGALIARAKADPRVDPQRVYVIGYSNGGFMAHRLGCEIEGLAGIASLAGAAPPDVATCKHVPRKVLEVHGDADRVVPFEGGHVLGDPRLPIHLGAIATLRGWAEAKGCKAAPAAGPAFDLDPDREGDETTALSPPCAPELVLLRVAGAGHDVVTSGVVVDRLLDRLLGP